MDTAANALLVIRCYSAVPRLKLGRPLRSAVGPVLTKNWLLFSRARQINSAARRDRRLVSPGPSELGWKLQNGCLLAWRWTEGAPTSPAGFGFSGKALPLERPNSI